MIPQDIHYDFPEAGYCIFAVIFFIVLFWILFQYRVRVLKGWKLAHMEFPRSQWIFWCKAVGLSAAWICLTIALMQPRGNGHYPEEAMSKPEKSGLQGQKAERQLKAHEVIFLIDASASMNVRDARTGKTRLEFAKEIADSIVSDLKGETASLYVFTSSLSQVVPPSMDYLFLRMLLRQVSINEGGDTGTDFVEALADIRKRYFIPNQKLKTLIMFSDGGDTYLETLQGEARRKEIDLIANLVGNAESAHLRVYTIGVGSSQGGNIPGIIFEGRQVHSSIIEEVLKKLSENGRGHFYFANDFTAAEIARDLMARMSQDNPYMENQTAHQVEISANEELIYDFYFQKPLGLALLLLAFVILFPEGVTKLQFEAKSQFLKWNEYMFRSIALFICFIAVFWKDFGWSQMHNTGDSQMLQAKIFFEARAYPQTLQIFQNLLVQKRPQWEKAILNYNIGCVLLAQGQLEQAILQFEQIALEDNSSPMFVQAIKTNLALARLRQANDVFNSIAKDPSPSLDKLDHVIILIQASLKEIQEAVKARCLLSKLEGETFCKTSQDLQAIHLAAKEQLAAVYAKYQDIKIHNVSWTEDISRLLSAIENAFSGLDFLEKAFSNQDIQQQYKTFFVAEEQSWMPMWDSLETASASHENQAISQARQKFLSGMRAMEHKLWQSSRDAFNASKSTLKTLLQKIFSSDPLIKAFQDLLSRYEAVLTQYPLNQNDVVSLEVQQSQIINLIQSKIEDQKFYSNFLLNAKDLSQAVQLLKEGYFIAARMMVQESKYQLRSLLQMLLPTKETPAQLTLESAIEAQKQSLILYQLQKLLEQGIDLNSLLINAQKRSVEIAAPFLSEVFTQQLKEFQSGNARCQCKPWDEVLPLFNQGYREASGAMDVNGFEANLLQEQALERWQEALLKMRQHQGNAKESPKQTEENEKQTGMPNFDLQHLSSAQLIQLLENMNQQDQRARTKNPVKKVLRPW